MSAELPILVPLTRADLAVIVRALEDLFLLEYRTAHRGADVHLRLNADAKATHARTLIDSLTPFRDLNRVSGPDPRD